MSFLNNSRPDRTPGPITGNNLGGICEKTCIQVKKVFDACIKQESYEDLLVVLTNIQPTTTPVAPYTFVSSRSTSTKPVISNLTVTPIDDGCGCSRVKCEIQIPIEVLFTDAEGTLYSGESSITITRDVKLHIPKPSVIPYEIDAIVNSVSPEGVYVTGDQFNLTCCVTSILKVVMEVELLIPSYGYCYIPACIEFKEEVCEGFFDLPLFPQDISCRR